MSNQKRFHSVRLEKDRCKGCTNCLKRCPTEAIRIRGGRAHIIDERCIDCGECIRVCDYHAKVAQTDPLSAISRFKYKIALPAPSLYGQFKNLSSISQIIAGLKQMGFDDVFEVARGADIVTRAIREKLRKKNGPTPLISGACPAIVRLIQVRFPALIDHIVDVKQPMEVAAIIAKKEFAKKKDVAEKDVGCFFITPCAAKVTAVHSNSGEEASAVDGAISILEIYGLLSSHTRTRVADNHLVQATSLGVSWANSGGEAMAVSPDDSMAVDGIENVIRVLEEVENENLSDVRFLECAACHGGCVGGPLTFENGYIAKNTIRKLAALISTEHPDEKVDVSYLTKYPIKREMPLLPNSVMRLDEDITSALVKMEQIEQIAANLPGYDCGACGSPTCKAFAEDIVKGYCREMDCVHKLKQHLKVMAQKMVDMAQTTRE